MFEKLGAFFRVLRVGNEVADPDKWMKRQADGNKVGLLILAVLGLAKAYGYNFPMSDNDALILGGAIVSIWNIVLTTVSSHKTGLLPAKPDAVGQPALPSPAPAEVRAEGEPQPKTEQPVVPAASGADTKGDGFDKSIYIG